MAVESVMLSLGTNAPPFALRDVVSGQVYQLDSFAGKSALLVMFLCRHCPLCPARPRRNRQAWAGLCGRAAWAL